MELINEFMVFFKEDAIFFYERNKFLMEEFGGKATSGSIKLLKATCITSAGIYNKNKEMYLKGYKKIEKIMRENMEGNFDNCELILDDGRNVDDLEVVAKNNYAFVKMCNHFRDQKKGIDIRHGHLMKYGYFDTT